MMLGAQSDSILRCRLAGISDLVAAEAKYHLKCFVTFFRKLKKSEASTCDSSVFNQSCIDTVINELETGVKAGYIFSVKGVWDRYCELVGTSETPSRDFDSNVLREFRNQLTLALGDRIEFVASARKRDSLLIIPAVSKETIVRTLKGCCDDKDTKEAEGLLLQTFAATNDDEDLFRAIYHVGSRVRMDMKAATGHITYDGIDKANVEAIVPESLFLLVSMLLGENDNEDHRDRILSIAQDIIYASSKGRKVTPKHIGLAIAIHHATRSKNLINVFHAAGHCVSYEFVQRIDTSIAKSELDRYKKNNSVVVPSNLVPGDFVQFAADNINILEETLDGKGQFNGTQCAAFQVVGDSNVVPSNETSVIGKVRFLTSSIQPDFHELLPSNYTSSARPSPVLPVVKLDWYKISDTNEAITEAKCKDLGWIQCRLANDYDKSGQLIPAWTGFNQIVSTVESKAIRVGYMPIIPAPADDMDTVYTVLSRCKYIAQSLGQQYTAISFDQALYCRAKEIVWLKAEEFSNVIIRLGGFHTAMNLMKAIGQHLEASGLKGIWVESGVFGENTAVHMMDGKAYNKAIRGHKLAFEALWRLLWNIFLKWADENSKEISGEIKIAVDEVVSAFRDHHVQMAETGFQKLVSLNHAVLDLMNEFEKDQSSKPTFQYWINYMDMVSILICFIRAERDGQWELYLTSFTKMLPWFALYGHTNYSRWGPVYLADMRLLETTAPDIHQQFLEGKFSVKRTDKKFCQVATDQALEHINKVSKVSGGIIGLTRRNASRDKWCLTYTEKARISDATFRMFDLNVDEDVDAEWCHTESGPTRLKRDEEDAQKIMCDFKRFNVFVYDGETGKELVCLTTRDVAPQDFTDEILSASEKGLSLVENFVSSRLKDKSTSFYATIPRNKTKTLGSMYNVDVPVAKGKQKTMKADRDLLRRLLVAAESGRDINLGNILQHELSTVPMALAGTNQTLHKTDKAQMVPLLTVNTEILDKLPKGNEKTCLLIDGPALIQAIGKPENAKTFGDLGDVFTTSVFSHFGSVYSRVDVIFDRYFDLSIKSGTRAHRTGKIRPIRRVIVSREVKLPQNWKQFISLPANKTELASFLSDELICRARDLPQEKELVVSGGFCDILKVWSSSRQDIQHISSTHEEADTRLILHAVDANQNGFKRVIISCRDTDVLILALAFRDQLGPEVWICSGTFKKRTYIPVHEINLPVKVIQNVLAFHAMTGCDTTSQFAGKGKKSAWKVFLKQPELFSLIGSGEISHDIIAGAEEFACMLYTEAACKSINDVRVKIFVKAKTNLDSLPPTKDALHKHIARANFQCLVWKKATTPTPELPCPTSSGWSLKDGRLLPELMTLGPIPTACKELVTCSCSSGCNRRCGCSKQGLVCTSACNCQGLCGNGPPIDEDSE